MEVLINPVKRADKQSVLNYVVYCPPKPITVFISQVDVEL